MGRNREMRPKLQMASKEHVNNRVREVFRVPSSKQHIKADQSLLLNSAGKWNEYLFSER